VSSFDRTAFSVSASLLLSIVLTWCTIRVCNRFGWVAYPRGDRWSRRTVAQFGGVAFLLSWAAATLLIAHSPGLPLLLLTFGMGAVGFIDDVFHLLPKWKLLAEIGIAATAVCFGVVYPLTASLLINATLSIVWIVGLANAFNLLDNMDGLSAGVAFIALVYIALLIPGQNSAGLVLMLAAALLGFLVFNFCPAQIFMGDTGSLALGSFLACASTAGAARIGSRASIVVLPSLIFILPIFDTLLVSVTRRLQGRAISAGARDHSSHRLVFLGMREKTAVITLYCFSALGGALAVVWHMARPQLGAGFLALFLFAVMLLWIHLAQVQMPHTWMSKSTVSTLILPEFLRIMRKQIGSIFQNAAQRGLSFYLAIGLRQQLSRASRNNCNYQ
jgi:UDP-GlcNAc:undecaprenyl-phosphate GlcNAc-1-phosphate transferase